MGGTDPAKAQAHLRVGGKDYHVVAAVLMMLGLIEGYLHFQEVVPVFTGEVAHRVVELLKVCCLACAGHGIGRTAGCTSITRSHDIACHHSQSLMPGCRACPLPAHACG